MKLDILAIGAHPDDVELSCSGTLLKHIAMGKKVGVLDLTHGELGTRGSGELRLKEAAASAKIMGLHYRENIGIPDGFFENSKENRIKIARVIRQYQPDIVLANALEDRHPDHGRGAKLISDACFIAGLIKVPIEGQDGLLDRWRPKAVYHYIQDNHLHPDFVIDISEFIEKKMECIQAFASQFYDPTSNEPGSPISDKNFLESVKAKNSVFGRSIQVAYAEGFNVQRPIGVDNLFDLR